MNSVTSAADSTHNFTPPSVSNFTPVFARHETFHPRFGWLKKGFDRASIEPEVFLRDDAPVVLGVGKNMVKAIRYWSYAFKIIDKENATPTTFGRQLLDDDGWDPFMEDPASLWLLHWHLLKVPCTATAWHFAFNDFHHVMFTVNDLMMSLQEYKEKVYPTAHASESSLKKDVHCLLRMYVPTDNLKGAKEDSIDCPFTDLGLINNYGDGKLYSFNMGSKNSLPDEIIVAACLEFAASLEGSAKTISTSRLLYELGSPGLIFKLTENALSHAIENVASHNEDISLSETAGLIQLSFNGEPDKMAEELLTQYYSK